MFINYLKFQNDMGLKPHDCAKLMGKKDCAEFLILYETSLDMSKELSEAQLKKDLFRTIMHKRWTLCEGHCGRVRRGRDIWFAPE